MSKRLFTESQIELPQANNEIKQSSSTGSSNTTTSTTTSKSTSQSSNIVETNAATTSCFSLTNDSQQIHVDRKLDKQIVYAGYKNLSKPLPNPPFGYTWIKVLISNDDIPLVLEEERDVNIAELTETSLINNEKSLSLPTIAPLSPGANINCNMWTNSITVANPILSVKESIKKVKDEQERERGKKIENENENENENEKDNKTENENVYDSEDDDDSNCISRISNNNNNNSMMTISVKEENYAKEWRTEWLIIEKERVQIDFEEIEPRKLIPPSSSQVPLYRVKRAGILKRINGSGPIMIVDNEKENREKQIKETKFDIKSDQEKEQEEEEEEEEEEEANNTQYKNDTNDNNDNGNDHNNTTNSDFFEHTVTEYDTLQGICLRYNTTIPDIKKYNDFPGEVFTCCPILLIPRFNSKLQEENNCSPAEKKKKRIILTEDDNHYKGKYKL